MNAVVFVVILAIVLTVVGLLGLGLDVTHREQVEVLRLAPVTPERPSVACTVGH